MTQLALTALCLASVAAALVVYACCVMAGRGE